MTADRTKTSSVLGYLLTSTQDFSAGTTTTVVKSSVARALAIWNSFLRDSGSNVSIATSSPSFLAGGTYPKRVSDAAYYYALQMVAEEYIRIRSGNVGSVANSSVTETILQKAQALLEIALAGIKAYEEWASAESALWGVDYIQLIEGAQHASIDGASANAANGTNMAQAEWASFPADLADLDSGSSNVPGLSGQLKAAAYGYALMFTGADLLQKRLGFSGARNPAIGQYYQSAGNAMRTAGKDLVDKFKAWVAVTKTQAAVGTMGF